MEPRSSYHGSRAGRSRQLRCSRCRAVSIAWRPTIFAPGRMEPRCARAGASTCVRSEAVAYGFVRDLLSKEESPELLMEAAWRAAALSRLSLALDHYERAIEIAPDFLPAYVEQLLLICTASASSDPELAEPFEIDLEF